MWSGHRSLSLALSQRKRLHIVMKKKGWEAFPSFFLCFLSTSKLNDLVKVDPVKATTITITITMSMFMSISISMSIFHIPYMMVCSIALATIDLLDHLAPLIRISAFFLPLFACVFVFNRSCWPSAIAALFLNTILLVVWLTTSIIWCVLRSPFSWFVEVMDRCALIL
mgnify:CR=1 FL=1